MPAMSFTSVVRIWPTKPFRSPSGTDQKLSGYPLAASEPARTNVIPPCKLDGLGAEFQG